MAAAASTSPVSPLTPSEIRAEAAGRGKDDGAKEHEADVEQREAYEYWGYLFKPDKTGTDKLKGLLRGLKDVMNQRYEPSDQPDLTPNQLAHFYRDLHGNYDQLFLGTPNESIAFIYKSLGCLHSLQPPSYTHATAFTDPTVPALKTEGWIMWQTIQLLLGPEEHSSFIREAVKTWEVRDHDTGEVFPKVLPRECFPMEADRHMVAWYEGVSERLRKEADEEERLKELEAEHAEPVRKLHASERAPARRDGDPPTDDEGSVDSRGPALAYFRNPLYRHVDGRPSIVRKNSKRPTLSPRHTMMDKGKEAATTFGRIAKSVGSPHLWDGRGTSRSRDRDSRRKSHPDNNYYHGDTLPPPSTNAYDDRYSPRVTLSHGHRRKASSLVDRPERPISAAMPPDDGYEAEDSSPVYSPEPRHTSGSDTSKHRQNESRPASRDQRLRPSRSHEPTPSQELEGDYFAGYDQEQTPRRNSAHAHGYGSSGAPEGNGVGPSFGPSASPLFAAHVARQSKPTRSHPGPLYNGGAPPSSYDGGPPRNPSIRRAQGMYPSRSPDPGNRPPPPPEQYRGDPRDRRFDSPGRPQSAPRYDETAPGAGQARYADSNALPRDPRDRRDSRDPRDARDSRRGSARASASDIDRYHSGGDDDRRSRPKQTRFAETGVKGRRYPDESPYSERRRAS